MKKVQLKKVFRVMLIEQPRLRKSIAADLMLHEQTIARWAKHNNESLTDKPFLNAFRKHTKATVELTEEVDINESEMVK
ncbi:MAG: hypothetical protein WC760_02805 [Bacteroidia bacterium]|jgi:hypothetical protein